MRPMRSGFACLAVGLTLVFATAALAAHNHPLKARTFEVTFVRSYQQCVGGPHLHDPPFAFPGCDPTTSSPALSFGPSGTGTYDGVVLLDAAKQTSDVKLVAKFTDVRVGDDGTAPGFDGQLVVVAVMRLTDHECDGNNTPCTAADLPFPLQVPCGSAATPPLPAGMCRAKSSANTVVPNAFTPGHQGNGELTQFLVYQGINQVFSAGIYLP